MKQMTIDDVSELISDHADAIKALFKPGMKITILVRNARHSDGSRDFVLTDDIIDEAIAALLRRKHDEQAGRRALQDKS